MSRFIRIIYKFLLGLDLCQNMLHTSREDTQRIAGTGIHHGIAKREKMAIFPNPGHWR
jgi:hypothetical protein